MGFKEIYLLGVDHSYSTEMDKNGSLIRKPDIKDHFSENDKVTNIPQLYKSTLAYEMAKKSAEKLGIKIYNVTRGGALEIFERRKLEDVL